jgi:hypothetical protein
MPLRVLACVFEVTLELVDLGGESRTLLVRVPCG